MNTFFEKIKNCKKTKILLLVLLGAVFILWFTRGDDLQQIHIVDFHDVEQVVLLSGEVQAVGQVDLSFDATGKVSTTTVSQGDVVVVGQVLAELDHRALEADLLQARGILQSTQSGISLAQASVQKAEANLALVRAQNRGTDSSIEAAESALKNAIVEQDILVKNAYLELLNNDLTAYPVDNYRNLPPPEVSGRYGEEIVGEYILDFYSSGASTGYSVRVSGLDNDTVSFDDYGISSLLGSKGLYLTLPESGEGNSYGNSDWVVPIPNNRSATYQTKLSAYEKAKQIQISVLAKAQATLDTLISQQASGASLAITTAQEQQAIAVLQEAESNLGQVYGSFAQAQAGVAKVDAQINNSVISAPFDGTIARIDYKIGQSVSPGFAGITLITNGDYELAMSIPEIDVAKVAVGDIAEIILDAYGDSAVWSGVLTEIELVETKVDGVPTYASVITIPDSDERIKIGMNARARIVIEEKIDVIAIPSSYIIREGDISIVLVQVDNHKVEQRAVKTGLTGTDYFVEITEGLQSGESIVSPADRLN